MHECPDREQIDKLLAEHNTRLVCDLLNPSRLFLQVERIKPRGKLADITPSYCPFCGTKIFD